MRSYFAALRQLVLPAGALPGTPRTVIGPDVPVELQNWVGTTFSQHCYFAQLNYDVTGGYVFAAYCYSDAIQISQQINGYMEPNATAHLFGTQGWNIAGVTGQSTFGYPGVAALALDLYSGFTVDGVSQGRGRVDFLADVGSSAAVGAEAVVLTTNTVTFAAGRAFEISVQGFGSGSVVSNTASFRVRRNNLAGAVIQNEARFLMSNNAGTSIHTEFRVIFRNATGAAITDNLVVTLQAINGGTVTMGGAADRPRTVEIRDIGAATDYANTVQV